MQKQKQGFLFLHNISKRNNIGGIIRSACAFNLSKVFYVGKQDSNCRKMKVMKEFSFFGNKGTMKKIEFHSFGTLAEAKAYFKQNNIYICGVQIGEGSKPVQQHPFQGDTAFFLGNEGTGLIPVHKEMCDHFVYIPQYTQKTASLNVGVAAGIIFHHFALWAKFPEAKVYGEKFKPLVYGQNESDDDDDHPKKKQQKPKDEVIEADLSELHEDIFKK